MAFWCSRLTQSKLRQLVHHSKTIPYASSLLKATKPCVSDNPLISHPGFGSKVRFFAAPVQANANVKKTEQGTNVPRMNEHIKANVIRLVVGEEHFVISRSEALERARKLELDLVQVQESGNPPVCKIMDYHKEQYKKDIREKERLKIKSKEVKTLRGDTKEVKFSPKTEAKDLKMKADMVKRFMDKGYRVKCTASDSEGRDLVAVFSNLIALIEDTAYIECEPTVGRGKESYIMVRHVKFGPPKGKKTKAEDKKNPEKGSPDGIGVTTRADTVPLPLQESSIREIPTPHFSPSMREQHSPYQRREAPTNSQFSSPTRESNRAAPPGFRNSAPLPNGIPKQEPSMREQHSPYQRREAPTNSQFSSPTRESNRAAPPGFRNSAPLPNGIPKQEPSMREQHIPYQRTEAPANSHFSSPTRESNRAAPPGFRNSAPLPNGIPKQEPSMREQHIPYQRTEAPANSHFSSPTTETNRAPPNGIPKQEPSNLNPPRYAGLKQEPSTPNPRSRSPGLGYGIFSTPTSIGSAQQGVSERFPANPNSPNSRPYTSQRPGTDICKDGQPGLGSFCRGSSTDLNRN